MIEVYLEIGGTSMHVVGEVEDVIKIINDFTGIKV